MLGRAFTVGVVTAAWFAGGLPHALAADASIIEQEPRSQQVVIVKPDGSGQPSEIEAPASTIAELEQAIRAERRKRDLLKLKLDVLREKVRAERLKFESHSASSPPWHRNPETAGDTTPQQDRPAAMEAPQSRGVVREYIWVPQHREGDKVIEGHYELRTQ